jgi:hypothetical protein
MTILNEDRLFPAESETRNIARRLYAEIRDLPILSPHGHTNAHWFAYDEPFRDPARLFIVPDHYAFRMLFSQGVPLHRSQRRPPLRGRSKRSMATLRETLLPVSRNTHPHVAGRRLPDTVWHGNASLRGQRRRLLRQHLRSVEESRISSPRFACSLLDRGACHHQFPAGFARGSQDHSVPWLKTRVLPPSGPTPWSIQIFRASLTTWSS